MRSSSTEMCMDRDENAQVDGHRLLRGDELQAAVLQLPALTVDDIVLFDDALGGLQVTVLQRLQRCGYGLLHHASQQEEVIQKVMQMNVKACACHRRLLA